MSEIYGDLCSELEIWIDDILGHSVTADSWLRLLDKVLARAQDRGLLLNAEKCELFLKEATFCGRIYTPDGVRQDPSRIKQLVDLPYPRTAKDLMKWMLAIQWMSRSIPDYNRLIAPLQDIYEAALKQATSRRKSAAAKMVLSAFGWNEEHEAAYDRVNAALAKQVLLAYPRSDWMQCMFTDASEIHASGLITQIPPEDVGKPFHEQRHEPLGFCGHRFSGSEVHWAIPDKEAFAVVLTFRVLGYLLTQIHPVHIYTDHRNLVRMFCPTECTKQASERLLRWAVYLMMWRYTIEHIDGDTNVWADMLTRWGANVIDHGEAGQDDAAKTLDAVVQTNGPVHPNMDHDGAFMTHDAMVHVNRVSLLEADVNEYRVTPMREFVWPSAQEIRKSQVLYLGHDPDETDLKLDDHGRLLIPSADKSLRIRLVVIAHGAPSGGHYGITLTISTLSRPFFWLELAEDVGKLVANCLHCLPTQGGQRIPRPLGTQIHGQKPNQVLHFDYVYIHPVKNGASHSHQWIFVVRDDFTGMVMLEPCATPNTSVTVQTLMKWRSLYGSSEFFVSDQGSYFVSEAMKEYCELVRSSHHVTTPYIHYPNGTVEVINKLVLQAFRCLISELRWKKEEWPYLLPTIMHYLNHKPQARLGGRAPIAVMTGMEADNPIEVTFRHLVTTGARTTNVFTVVDSGVVDKYISDLQDHLQVMHKDVADMRRLNELVIARQS